MSKRKPHSPVFKAKVVLETRNETIQMFGPPEIMNTELGSQLTSFAGLTSCTDPAWCVSPSAIARIRLPAMEGMTGAGSSTTPSSSGCGGP